MQAGCEASPQMLIKSQYGSAALASVPTLTWPLKGCIATTMRGEKPFGGTDGECQTGSKHKEEVEKRRKMDETDRNKIAEELQKNLHPHNVKSTALYNIANGRIPIP